MIGSKQTGLIRNATIKSVDLNDGTAVVTLDLAKSDAFKREHTISIPASWMGPGGQFAGGYPVVGASIKVSQGQGGRWSFVSYNTSDGIFGNNSVPSLSSARRNRMSALKQGRHLIQVQGGNRHIVDPTLGVQFGNPEQYVRADPKTKIKSSVFDYSMDFSEAHRKVEGIVYRANKPNAAQNVSGSSLTSHIYQRSLTQIGLDARTNPGDAFYRNPAFNESREIVYEFPYSFGFTDDTNEQAIYDGEQIPDADTFVNRRASRADALSLSIIEPNYLIETIKGTVVDIYGNVVDLNRSIIPLGVDDSLSLRGVETLASETFKNLREKARKSIAYHFEINARKAVSPDLSNLDLFDLFLEDSDYARNRSKFSVDIDKEGQFKINVPSSSEVGNVSLPVRAENYSTISASENETSPKQFVRNETNQDLFLDSFGQGVVSISNDEAEGTDLEGLAAPVDRLTGNPIKLGTVFHNINETLSLHSLESDPIPLYPNSKINQIPKVENVVSQEVIVSGDNANAGGRSGTINLDGMLNMSIGANTVDRQSLWLDCAGGVVSNIGRDKNDVSYAGRFDGDILVQIGGVTPSDDSRFQDQNNGYRAGALDIRVASGGMMHVVRIDESGVRVYSAGEVDIVSEGHLKLESRKGNLYLNGESIYMYANDRNNGRLVARSFNNGKGKTIR